MGPGGGRVGKTTVVGMKDRGTKQVAAQVIEHTDVSTLQGFVDEHAEPEAAVYTDGATAYRGRKNHETVHHSVGEYVQVPCRGDSPHQCGWSASSPC